MNIYESGWIHEDDKGETTYDTPANALLGYLRFFRGSCDDDTDEREVDGLDATEHRIVYMEGKILATEEQRESELVGIDDEESMIEMPIGSMYFRETKSVRYKVSLWANGTDESGSLTISYERKVKP